MCFYKRIGDKIQIAKKDITVYKVVRYYHVNNNSFTSLYQEFLYEFNKLYKEPCFDTISYGFHSYKYSKYLNNGVIISKKLSYCKRYYNEHYTDSIILECTIPKGSIYIFNSTDYISNQIIIDNIVLPPDNLYKLLPEDFRDLIEKHYTIS